MKKVEQQQQKEQFTSISNASNAQASLMIIRKFLADNILLPLNADGDVVAVNTIGVNLGARIIMMAVEPDSYQSLQDIFAAPEKEDWRAQIDDKELSFNEEWNTVANIFF